MAAKKLNKLKNSVNHNIHAKRLTHIAYNIKQKLHTGQAMITKADKGRIIVIINKEEYNSKTLTFIHNNNFQSLNSDKISQNHKRQPKTM